MGERRVTADGRILERGPDGTVQVVGTVGGVPSNPLKVQEATTGIAGTQATTTGKNFENVVKGATISPQIKTIVASADKGEADAAGAQQNLRLNALSSAQYSDALGQFNAAKEIQSMRRDLRESFDRGPGTTQGFPAGLADFIPNLLNEGTQRYDKAANRMRAFAKSGTGTTGGENNSLAEMKLNLGAYIPSSINFDSTNEDAHTAIGKLGDKGFRESIQRLGGIPDAMGNILPLDSPEGKKLVAEYQALAAAGQPRPAAPGRDDNSTPGLYDANGNFTGVDPRGGGDDGEVLTGTVSGNASEWDANGNYIGPDSGSDSGPSGYEQFLKDTLERQGAGDPTSGQNYAMRAAGGAMFGLQDEFSGLRGGMYSLLHGQNPATGYKLLRDAERMRQHQNEGGQGWAGTAAEIAGSLPTSFLLGNGARIKDAAKAGARFGGLHGYGSGNGLEGSAVSAAGGAVAGGAGGALGGFIGEGAGRLLTGVRSSPTIARLRAQGVTPSLGEIMRGRAFDNGKRSWVADIEDAVSNTPGAGAFVNTARTRSLGQGNTAAYRTVGEGAPIKGVGANALNQLDNVKTSAYDDALNGVSLPANEARFASQVSRADNTGRQIDGLRGKGDFAYVMDHELAPVFNGGGSAINGRQLQDSLRLLQGQGRSFTKAANGPMPDPAAKGVANALGGVEDAFVGLTARHAPGAIPKLKIANRMNRGLNVLDDAANRGINTGGVFTGPQLGAAIKANNSQFGGRGLRNAEKSPLFQLQQDMTNTLSNKVPPTGVNAAPILAGAGLLAGGVNERTGYDSNAIRIAAGLAMLSAPYTKTGSWGVAKALLDRPEWSKGLGALVRKHKGLFGAAVAPLALETRK